MMQLLVQIRDQSSMWLMRLLEGGRVLQMPLLAVTAISTLGTFLRGTPLEPYTYYIISGFGLMAIGFVWAYDRFEVLNLQNKAKQDRADNFVGPGFTMGSIMRARQLAIIGEALQHDYSSAELHQRMDEETKALLRDWRNGVDLAEIYQDATGFKNPGSISSSPQTAPDGGYDDGDMARCPECEHCRDRNRNQEVE